MSSYWDWLPKETQGIILYKKWLLEWKDNMQAVNEDVLGLSMYNESSGKCEWLQSYNCDEDIEYDMWFNTLFDKCYFKYCKKCEIFHYSWYNDIIIYTANINGSPYLLI